MRPEPGTTRNKEGGSFYLPTVLRTLVTAQLKSVAALNQQGTITAYVFHYPDGVRILKTEYQLRATATPTIPIPNRVRPNAR